MNRSAPPAVWLGMVSIDRVTLQACSDALATTGLWERSARLGELASAPDDDVPGRLELGWRLCRSGRPDQALAHLRCLRDDAHPMVPLVRAAGAAFRDRAPAALAAVLREASLLQPVGIVLRVVAVTAFAVGDRAVALDAASRYLATIDPDDPEMRRIVAPAQAKVGDIDSAVSSVEWARNGRPADPDRPVRDILDDLLAAGDTGAALRLLATAFHATGRPVYGELLVANLPARVLNRERSLLISMSCVVGAYAAGVLLFRVLGPAAPIAAVLLAVVGIGLFFRAVLVRAPGLGQEQTNQINKAATVHRRRTGTFSPWRSVAAAVTFVLAFAAIVLGQGGGRLSTTTVFVLVGAAIPVAALTAGVALLVGRRVRTRLAAAEEAVRVSADRCRCWEREWFNGPAWRAYCSVHLVPSLTDPATGVVLLRCPTTATTWLSVADADLVVRVRLPEGAERKDLPTGAYL